MDWARAKNILIALLFALNIILMSAIVSRTLRNGDSDELYRNVTAAMDSRGVSMECDFPRGIKDSELLVYGDGARYIEETARKMTGLSGTAVVTLPGRETLLYTDANPLKTVEMESDADIDASVRGLLTDMGIDMRRFKTDGITSIKSHTGDRKGESAEDGVGESNGESNGESAVEGIGAADGNGYSLRYVLIFEDHLVFDSNISVTVTNDGGLSEVSVNYRDIKSVAQDKKMKVMPAYQVLLKNFNRNGDIIDSIDIGFMGQNTDRENPYIESEEGAVWRVRLTDGRERFFEAMYGDEITVV